MSRVKDIHSRYEVASVAFKEATMDMAKLTEKVCSILDAVDIPYSLEHFRYSSDTSSETYYLEMTDAPDGYSGISREDRRYYESVTVYVNDGILDEEVDAIVDAFEEEDAEDYGSSRKLVHPCIRISFERDD